MLPEEKAVCFTPTRSDLLAFQFRVLIQNRLLICFAGIGFLVVMISEIAHPPNPPVPFAVRFAAGIIAGLAVVIVGAIGGFLFAAMTIWTGKFQNVLTRQTTVIKEEGLASSSANGEGLIRWAGIHKIQSTSKLLIIYTNETTARIIPKRFFSSRNAASAFEQEIRARIKSG
ncbi:MAG TPA: YcxB family protein [Verrucomicrobiae bacterium]|jgi:hypothetical protein|nr:YcxB family protein [Verrucomicrobiae bacterium]